MRSRALSCQGDLHPQSLVIDQRAEGQEEDASEKREAEAMSSCMSRFHTSNAVTREKSTLWILRFPLRAKLETSHCHRDNKAQCECLHRLAKLDSTLRIIAHIFQ